MDLRYFLPKDSNMCESVKTEIVSNGQAIEITVTNFYDEYANACLDKTQALQLKEELEKFLQNEN